MIMTKLLKLWLPIAFSMLEVGEAARGVTTRYWDCCKPSCSWSGKAQVSKPVNTCDRQDHYFPNDNVPSACNGGLAFTCSNQGPWAVNDDLAYGFAAAKLAGKNERDWCCACYKYVYPCVITSVLFLAYTSVQANLHFGFGCR